MKLIKRYSIIQVVQSWYWVDTHAVVPSVHVDHRQAFYLVEVLPLHYTRVVVAFVPVGIRSGVGSVECEGFPPTHTHLL